MKNPVPLWSWAQERLVDKVTIITGAGRGMGKEVAFQLLSVGGRVAIVDRDQARLDQTLDDFRDWSHKVIAIRGDVTVQKDIDGMVQTVLSKFGRVDNLVNCAGGYKAKSPSLQVDDAEWDM
ncbi:MAG: SDR family NAD(P)-dependent oxidoreductase, partial [Vulcanimicrobiaceae bacterium]